MNLSRTTDRRRAVALAVLACLSIGSAVGLAGGLVSCAPADDPADARPLSAAEAQRLASMRLVNYRDERAAVEADYGTGEGTVRLSGWVDWTRSLAYLNVGGPGAGADRGLVQAVPGLLARRPAADPARPNGTVDAPPVTPPADGWTIRPFSVGADKPPAPLESFLALLFTVAADRPDAAEVLEHSESRWLGTETLGGTTVDVLLGPAVPPREARPAATPTGAPSTNPPSSASPTPAPSALAQMGGGVRYFVDASSRMHRFEALLGEGLPVEVDVNRTDNPDFAGIAAFGGAVVEPRAVSPEEATVLSRVAQRNFSRRGGTVELAVPTSPSVDLRGGGWIDWAEGVAYLAVRDLEKPADAGLLRADRQGMAVLTSKAGAKARPPLPAPADGDGWTYQTWVRRADAAGGLDLDLLIAEALTLAADRRDDAGALRGRSSWLRTDTVGGRPVTVYEIFKPQERGARRGQARMRYWVDAGGGLRRIELRTRAGAFAQFDITPGEVPDLPGDRGR